jgi:hypothetical protein
MFSYLKNNKLVIGSLVAVVFLVSFYTNLSYFVKEPQQLRFFPPFVEGVNLNYNAHLGAEYYFIAEALVAGKGFSDPFQVDSGPTAWMPPLYSFLLAVLIFIFKLKPVVTCVIIFLKNAVLVFAGIAVYEVAKRTTVRIKAEFAVFLYLVFLLSSYRRFFQFTHDSWLLLFLITLIFIAGVFVSENRINVKTAVVWGIIGGGSMLASPILGLVWLMLWLLNFLNREKMKLLSVSAFLFLAICLPWVGRNYVVFNKLIFMKSNLFYDLHQLNYTTNSGILDETFEKKHLAWTVKNDPNSAYRKLGEGKFLEIYEKKFITEIKRNPSPYFHNTINRFLAAFLVYHPYQKYERVIILKSFLHTFPFVCLLLIMLTMRRGTSIYITYGILIYILYLLPYVCVAYYFRYALPITPLKVLFCFWGVDLIASRVSQNRKAPNSGIA